MACTSRVVSLSCMLHPRPWEFFFLIAATELVGFDLFGLVVYDKDISQRLPNNTPFPLQYLCNSKYLMNRSTEQPRFVQSRTIIILVIQSTLLGGKVASEALWNIAAGLSSRRPSLGSLVRVFGSGGPLGWIPSLQTKSRQRNILKLRSRKPRSMDELNSSSARFLAPVKRTKFLRRGFLN